MAKYYVELAERELGFEITQSGGVTHLRSLGDGGDDGAAAVDFVPVQSNVETGAGLYSLLVDGKSYQLYVEKRGEHFRVMIWRHRYDVKVHTEREWRLMKVAPKQAAQGGARVVSAPMPGLVKAVLVEAGGEVKAGTRLVVLEAMKMENEITAPRDARVAQVHVQPGNVVEADSPLVTLE
ncbi:MAG: biotin/lipoyl-binding protein [Chloroflexota bacterium]|nr:biotin/lipoyl-binding protein [Chloroflexota bacterium]